MRKIKPKGAIEQILKLYENLAENDKDRLLSELLQMTATGRKIAQYGVEGASRIPITYITKRIKPLAEVTGADIPRGFSAEDVATDCEDE